MAILAKREADHLVSETIFSKIASSQVPAQIIYRSENTCAFLDHNPVTKGHALVIPNQAIDHLDDCSKELYSEIFDTVREVSRQLKQAFKPERIGLVVHGFDVPHAHVHVIPIYQHGDLKFPKRPDRFPEDDELAAIAAELAKVAT